MTEGESHPDSGDVVTPIHLSSTFELPGIDPDMDLMALDPDQNQYVYSRINNPTRNALEHRMAALEDGEHAAAFSSGTAAICTTVLATLEPGDHMVAFDDLYGGTKAMFDELIQARLDIDVTYVDARDTQNVADAMQDDTRLVFMETPTNPLLKLCDIATIADIAHKHDAVLAVDNTFASPAFQRPLELDADISVASTTKYLNGHSDGIGGVVVTSNAKIHDEVTFLQQVGMGNMLAPFDAYQVLRGVKTLPARMTQHEANASTLAEWLEDHTTVKTVLYPGLASHPQHALAQEQMEGYGGMVTFVLDGGMEDAQRFLEGLEHIPVAVSLGGVESLIEHPASMTHSELTPEEREEAGIADGLLRLSVGIENVKDLQQDLQRGFDAMN